jgi:hypothetical protein
MINPSGWLIDQLFEQSIAQQAPEVTPLLGSTALA